MWERFTASREESLWFYRELVRAFLEAGATGYLIEALDSTVAELERRSGMAGSNVQGATSRTPTVRDAET